ncbi:SDR family NAD(P)-dependent oxidoreductase [Tautonia plasticadhaerens]|uniref:3-oxoacyl-[acyl-carrier-protein] reductase FabG n=1 Tax=Tautonia plasticadhaerens TaxID=2527974 RepID=A0A518HEU1_9BACT|nr:SDR family NAD(P)-dependent oxidoreductase [Tautonia plasticadhaerens]QDV39354.1 3-oxoacyl-[acyl-carrier-protein] reductase FabG [Tautonia plasticadhaerens]
MQLDGRTFLIAGGSSGLGAACARRLTGRGASVVIADIDERRGATLASELGDRAAFAPADVTDEDGVGRAIATARDRFGDLHGAVVCAGIHRAEKVLRRDGVASLDAFRRVVEVNLVGTFNVVRLAADALRSAPEGEDGERGVIVMTSSIAAYESQVGQAAYAASKGGVASMTLPIARELSRFGIRVVSVAPGVFETPMMVGVAEDVRRSLADQIPFPPRFGQPDEFAALVEHIITNRMLNGAVLRLDGAMRMQAR